MATRYVSLPLYTDADYQYEVNLEGNYYTLRIYYNERVEGWFVEIRSGENDLLVAGEQLVVYHLIMGFYSQLPDLTGFFWLEPKGDYANNILGSTVNLSEYYRLYYVYTDGT